MRQTGTLPTRRCQCGQTLLGLSLCQSRTPRRGQSRAGNLRRRRTRRGGGGGGRRTGTGCSGRLAGKQLEHPASSCPRQPLPELLPATVSPGEWPTHSPHLSLRWEITWPWWEHAPACVGSGCTALLEAERGTLGLCPGPRPLTEPHSEEDCPMGHHKGFTVPPRGCAYTYSD